MESAANILLQYLADEEVIVVGTRGAWPGFVGSMPNEPGLHPQNNPRDKIDNIITIYDTAAALDGRIMKKDGSAFKTGEVIEHKGIQIRVRGADYPTGWAKAEELKAVLDGIQREEVALNGTGYIISNSHRISGIISIGPEGESKRELFTINLLLTLKEI